MFLFTVKMSIVPVDQSVMELGTCQPGVAEKYLRNAVVEYPDSSSDTFRIHKNADGQVLFDLAADYVKMDKQDKRYFSLVYIDKRTKKPRFLNNERAVAKQSDIRNWKFTFTFKFFPQEPSVLSLKSRKFLVEQCRSDIYSRKIPADTETQAQLASYIAQAELGDYKPSDTYGHYVRNGRFASSVDYDFVNAVQEYHLRRIGQKEHEAYMFYLNYCKNLPLYGIHCYETKDHDNGIPIEMGVGARGLLTYIHGKGVTHLFEWKYIDKISFRRKFFCMKFLNVLPKQDQDLEGSTIVFKLSSSSVAERFYKLAVEHHGFFRLLKTAPKAKGKRSFFRWATERFRSHKRHDSDTVVVPDERKYLNETIRTIGLEETMDDANDTMNISLIDRTQGSDQGSVYSLETEMAKLAIAEQEEVEPEEELNVGMENKEEEVDHDAALIRAILDATMLDPDVVVERVEMRESVC
ncbi:hypothetical protein L596_007918 [Steinernema carpocapsae]|uniref:FERM domain-containing protein n=1 Tax=Steinernema carpocapsae TaxID=34508 RepID=A0A4U5PBV7_STECR|nr:hypothetical protein L596_007918 [Steinernema carpocapsae]